MSAILEDKRHKSEENYSQNKDRRVVWHDLNGIDDCSISAYG